jgi:hypothetical protein
MTKANRCLTKNAQCAARSSASGRCAQTESYRARPNATCTAANRRVQRPMPERNALLKPKESAGSSIARKARSANPTRFPLSHYNSRRCQMSSAYISCPRRRRLIHNAQLAPDFCRSLAIEPTLPFQNGDYRRRPAESTGPKRSEKERKPPRHLSTWPHDLAAVDRLQSTKPGRDQNAVLQAARRICHDARP